MPSDKSNILKGTLKQIDEIVDKNMRIVKAWASVEVRDKQGEIIPMEELRKIMPVLMDRGAMIHDTHTNRTAGKIINYEFAIHPKTKAEGLLLTYKIFNNGYKSDDQIWEEIKSGKRTGLSFGGIANMSDMVKDGDGEPVRELSDLEGFEFSSVDNPANQEALNFEANLIAKSNIEKITPESSGKIQRLMQLRGKYPNLSDKELSELAELERELRLGKSLKEEIVKMQNRLSEIEKKFILTSKTKGIETNDKPRAADCKRKNRDLMENNNEENNNGNGENGNGNNNDEKLPMDEDKTSERISALETKVSKILEILTPKQEVTSTKQGDGEETKLPKTIDDHEPGAAGSAVTDKITIAEKDLTEIKKSIAVIEKAMKNKSSTPRPEAVSTEPISVFKGEKDVALQIAKGLKKFDLGAIREMEETSHEEELKRILGR